MAYAGTTHLSGSEASTVRARVAQIITHPSYNSDTADFDVAVLRLGSPLPFSRHVQPVCLPAASHVFPPRKKCLISGWGYLKEDFRKLSPSQRENPADRTGRPLYPPYPRFLICELTYLLTPIWNLKGAQTAICAHLRPCTEQ